MANQVPCFRRFPFTTSYRDVTKEGCDATDVNFISTEPSANQACVSSVLLTDLSSCPWDHNCKLGGRRQYSSRDHGRLGHSLRNLLISSGLFQLCYIYTTSTWWWNVCCAHAILWPGSSDNAQFLMRRSGHMDTYRLINQHAVSKAQFQARSCFSKGGYISAENGRDLQ